MGLDVMELIMDIEKHFGVTLPDERAGRITTVAELYTFLAGQTRRGAPMPCPTNRAFYGLRRTLVGEFGVDRSRVKPAARLRDLFPAPSRVAAWPRLAAALGLPDLPDADPPRRLPRPKTLGIGLAIATVVAALLVPVFILFPDKDPTPPVVWWFISWVGLMVLVFEFYGMVWIGRYFEPRTIPRVRDLVVRLASRSARDAAEPAPTTLWAELTAILEKHTGMPAGEIRPENGFYELVRR